VIELEEKVTELINPEIVRASGEVIDWEGCLSVPGFVAEVHRHAKVTVKAGTVTARSSASRARTSSRERCSTRSTT
jgi:peptide deformylase